MNRRFSKYYGLATSVLLLLEAGIALFAHDRFIRPYVGDVLAPVFLYCLLRSVSTVTAGFAAGVALAVAFLVEGLQYVDVLNWLGWQHSNLARTVLGSHFAWADLGAYALGALAVWLVERPRPRRSTASKRSQPSPAGDGQINAY